MRHFFLEKLSKLFFTRDVSVVLAVTFFCLLSILLFIGYSNQQRLLDMNDVIEKNQIASKKMQMVNNLTELARMRTRLTAKVIYEEDPFVQDEIGMELDILASRFARLRSELLTLPLSPQELDHLDKQGEIVLTILPAQRLSIELAMSGDEESLKEAERVLHELVNPGQNQLVNIFMKLIDLQKKSIDTLSTLSKSSYEISRRQNSILVGVALVFGFLISIVAILRVVGIQKNIASARDQLELAVIERTQELAESQMTLQTVLDTIPTRVFWKDTNGIYRGCNRLFAIDSGLEDMKDIIGKHEYELMDYSHTIGDENEDNDIIDTGKAIINQEICSNNLGHKVWLEVTKVPLKNENDEVIGMLGSYNDVSERKRTDHMKDEFVSTVSHELRTPLTSINGSLSLLLGGAVGEFSAKGHRLLELANRNTKRLLNLIGDLLDLQKMEAGEMQYEFAPADMSKVLENAAEENKEYASQFNISLIITESCNVTMSVDENRIMQVLNNLISNAIKFSNPGSNVDLSLITTENSALIKVTDYGRGIPEHFQSTLFGKFTQADSSDSRQKGGTGLGLAITKNIVEKHNGEISFDSKEGEGTTFCIEIPIIS